MIPVEWFDQAGYAKDHTQRHALARSSLPADGKRYRILHLGENREGGLILSTVLDSHWEPWESTTHQHKVDEYCSYTTKACDCINPNACPMCHRVYQPSWVGAVRQGEIQKLIDAGYEILKDGTKLQPDDRGWWTNKNSPDEIGYANNEYGWRVYVEDDFEAGQVDEPFRLLGFRKRTT